MKSYTLEKTPTSGGFQGYFSGPVVPAVPNPKPKIEKGTVPTMYTTSVPLIPADNRMGDMTGRAEKTLGYTAEVKAFIEKHNLEGTLEESRAQLRIAFDGSLSIRYMLVSDPEDGSDVLSVDVLTPTAQVEDADARLSDFCYDWWYDYEGKGRGLMRFRVVETLAV